MLMRRHIQILSDNKGASIIEFAVTLPLFVIILTGGIELTNLALVHLRLNNAAETVADNAARVRSQMDEYDMGQIFEGVELQAESIKLADKGRVILSSVEDNGKNGAAKGQTIKWQRCHGKKNSPPAYGKEGKGNSDGSMKNGIGKPGREIAALPGSAVMHAEVVYDYEPLIFDQLIGKRELRYESAFSVRERTEFGITNVKGKPKKTC